MRREEWQSFLGNNAYSALRIFPVLGRAYNFLSTKHEHVQDELQLTRLILCFSVNCAASGYCDAIDDFGRKMN